MQPLLAAVLKSRENATEAVHERRLWVNELKRDFEPLVHQQITQIMWDALLNTIAAGYGDLETEKFLDGLTKHPNIFY